MNSMKEFMAMMRAVKVMETVLESKEEDRRAIVCAKFEKDGRLAVKIDGRHDFLMAAMSTLLFDLAKEAEIDTEELYYMLCAINGIREDMEDIVVEESDDDDDKLKVRFNGEPEV